MGWSASAVESASAMAGIGAEMPGQIERQLHARREFREALVDAELEIERAVLMPQHDRRLRPACRRRAASRSRTGRVAASAAVARRIKAASPSSCASAVPRLAFQPLASSARNVSSAAATSCRRARHLETGPRRARPAGCAGGAALSASWRRAPRAAIHRRRACASRQARTCDCSTQRAHAVAPQHFA